MDGQLADGRVTPRYDPAWEKEIIWYTHRIREWCETVPLNKTKEKKRLQRKDSRNSRISIEKRKGRDKSNQGFEKKKNTPPSKLTSIGRNIRERARIQSIDHEKVKRRNTGGPPPYLNAKRWFRLYLVWRDNKKCGGSWPAKNRNKTNMSDKKEGLNKRIEGRVKKRERS